MTDLRWHHGPARPAREAYWLLARIRNHAAIEGATDP